MLEEVGASVRPFHPRGASASEVVNMRASVRATRHRSPTHGRTMALLLKLFSNQFKNRLNPKISPLTNSRFRVVADQTFLLQVVELYVVNNFA